VISHKLMLARALISHLRWQLPPTGGSLYSENWFPWQKNGCPWQKAAMLL